MPSVGAALKEMSRSVSMTDRRPRRPLLRRVCCLLGRHTWETISPIGTMMVPGRGPVVEMRPSPDGAYLGCRACGRTCRRALPDRDSSRPRHRSGRCA